MKKTELEKEAREVLDFTINILEELESLIEQDYCQVCSRLDKKSWKQIKKNSKIISKAYSEIIKRKELKIE